MHLDNCRVFSLIWIVWCDVDEVFTLPVELRICPVYVFCKLLASYSAGCYSSEFLLRVVFRPISFRCGIH